MSGLMRPGSLLLLTIVWLAVSCKGHQQAKQSMFAPFEATGRVEKIYQHEIPNKARGGKPKYEARLILLVTDTGEERLETFGGGLEWIDKVKTGDYVKVIATTSTGRKIQTVEVLPVTD